MPSYLSHIGHLGLICTVFVPPTDLVFIPIASTSSGYLVKSRPFSVIEVFPLLGVAEVVIYHTARLCCVTGVVRVPLDVVIL